MMEIKICMGTMCYVMGGAELRSMVEALAEDPDYDIEVSYSPCLGVCDKAAGEPPYIEVDGKIIGGVRKSTLLQIIKEKQKDAV